MAVVLRLSRCGRRNRPHYRVVAADSRKPRDGRHIEILGHYDPLHTGEGDGMKLNEERAAYWVSVGAQPSDTIASFLKTRGIKTPAQLKRERRLNKKQSANNG